MVKKALFNECRKCYNHIGGKISVSYFEFLFNHSLISYVDQIKHQNSRQRLSLKITDKGIKYFKFLNSNIKKEGYASACLDGTEKKPHLSGMLGDLLFKYLKDKKYIIEQQDSRILIYEYNILEHLTDLFKQKLI